MDSSTNSDLLDDVHGVLDQLRVPPANADLGSADDQGRTDEPYKEFMLVR
jgi:hypothetical protein